MSAVTSPVLHPSHHRGLRIFVFLGTIPWGGCMTQERGAGGDERWYSEPPMVVSRVAADVLLDRGFQIESDIHEAHEGEITARMGTQRVSCVYTQIEWGQTQLTVTLSESDPVLAQELLNDVTARVGSLGYHPDDSRAYLHGRFDSPVAESAVAAEMALSALGMEITQERLQFSQAVLSGKSPDDRQVEVTIQAIDQASSHVWFAAIAPSQLDSDLLALQVKTEFEKALPLLEKK